MAKKKDTGVYTFGNYGGSVLIFRNGLPHSIRTDNWDFEKARENVEDDYGTRLEHKHDAEFDGHYATKIPNASAGEAYEFLVWVNEVDMEHMRSEGRQPTFPTTPLRGKRYL